MDPIYQAYLSIDDATDTELHIRILTESKAILTVITAAEDQIEEQIRKSEKDDIISRPDDTKVHLTTKKELHTKSLYHSKEDCSAMKKSCMIGDGLTISIC
ncbi:Hypothetical predicted protein [Mytilus galloprovincialis]|uniref:Uncharacterized protein n=1 Tax=Mytilus galloprovincialis TaxID=29158 RepID=A0A8B6H7S8_MYTGA|nr:Hypothetical predicted protein [Mytilus galloprovincialis]VDI75837.1 Hypothetical predicted protein [Mytilus galloprovincialis]